MPATAALVPRGRAQKPSPAAGRGASRGHSTSAKKNQPNEAAMPDQSIVSAPRCRGEPLLRKNLIKAGAPPPDAVRGWDLVCWSLGLQGPTLDCADPWYIITGLAWTIKELGLPNQRPPLTTKSQFHRTRFLLHSKYRRIMAFNAWTHSFEMGEEYDV